MIYIWDTPNDYPERLIGLYDDSKEFPARGEFRKCQRIFKKLPSPHIRFNCNKLDIIKYNCLINSTLIPVVDLKLRSILNNLCEDDVQYFDAAIECNDGFLKGYQLLNITHCVSGTDRKQSRFSIIAGAENAILGFNYLVLKPGCLKSHEIARDSEYQSHILVSEKLSTEFKRHKITGVSLITSEEYNSIY